jgi:quercetin dioxygenase-like cupin family protein
MKLPSTRFTHAPLATLPQTKDLGEIGFSLSQTLGVADVRLRIVDYQPGYLSDHWCDRGHVFHVIEGEAIVELKDGRSFALRAGHSFVVSDYGDAPHRVRTEGGCRAFIVD